MQVLGVAHSHPDRCSRPSDRDRVWGIPGTLMVIRGSDAVHQAWWLSPERQVLPLPIEVWDTQVKPGSVRS